MPKVTLDDLIGLFEEVVDVSGIQLDTAAVLGEDIPLDSREMLRILSRIESRYRFRFAPKEILGLKTLGDVLEAVCRHVNTGN